MCQAIASALDRLADGGAAAFVVSGEPGIGKSALLRATADEAQARGLRAVRVRATALARHVPLGCLVEALDPGHRTAADVRAHLARLAEEPGLVLTVDDAEQADAATLELLGGLVSRPPPGGVLLMLAAAEVPAPLAALPATAVRLAPLPRRAIAEITGVRDRRLLHRLQLECGGVPLLAKELAAAWRASGPPHGPDDDEPVPRAIVDTAEAQVAALPPDARDLVRAGAVLGAVFDAELAASVAGFGPDTRAAAASAAVAGGLLVPLGFPDRLAFRRPVIRRAVYAGAGTAFRTGAHARAAEALTRQGAPAHVRAHHVARSARPSDGAAVALLAGVARRRASTEPAAAIGWLTSALALVGDRDDRRSELLALRAACATMAGRFGDAERDLAEAVRGELGTADPAAALAALARDVHGGRREARSLLLALLDGAEDPEAAAAVHAALGVEGWKRGDRRRLAEHAAHTARLAGPHDLDALVLGALTAYDAGHVSEAHARSARIRVLVDAAADADLAPRLGTVLAAAYVETGLERSAGAAALLRRVRAIARATGQRHLDVPLACAESSAALRRGDLRVALARADDAVAAAERLGGVEPQMWAQTARCRATATAGDFTASLDAGTRATAAAAAAPDGPFRALAYCAHGVALIFAGDPAEGAAVIVRHAGPRLEALPAPTRPAWLGTLADVASMLGRMDEAAWWAAEAQRSADELGLPGRLARVARTRAMLHLAAGRPALAAGVAEQAAEGLRAAGQPLDAARADVLAGRAYLEAGEEACGLDRLERVHGTLVDLGASRDVDAVASVLRRRGRRMGRPVRSRARGSGPAALTPREREVAALVTRGLGNRAIAEALFVSERTVETHVSQVMRKLGVGSRAGLATVVLRPDADPRHAA